jgi:hypothetical protein
MDQLIALRGRLDFTAAEEDERIVTCSPFLVPTPRLMRLRRIQRRVEETISTSVVSIASIVEHELQQEHDELVAELEAQLRTQLAAEHTQHTEVHDG